jgi:hypothetical protein
MEGSMTELSERLKHLAEKPSGPCPVGKLLEKMDAETAEALRQALDGRAATRVIHSELTNAGIHIGRDTIAAHRNGWCRCKAAQA